jgi:hypothetical protein
MLHALERCRIEPINIAGMSEPRLRAALACDDDLADYGAIIGLDRSRRQHQQAATERNKKFQSQEPPRRISLHYHQQN